MSTKELMLLNCVAGEDSWESLGLQGDPTSPSKGDKSWVFIGRTDAEAETPILWPPHVKSWLIGKDPDAGRDWEQEEKGTTGDDMAGWHHRLDAHEFGWTPGVGDGQGGLACCYSWGSQSWTRLSDWTELNFICFFIRIDKCIFKVVFFRNNRWKELEPPCLPWWNSNFFFFFPFSFLCTAKYRNKGKNIYFNWSYYSIYCILSSDIAMSHYF